MPKEQMDTMMSEYYAFTESIKKSGQYIGGEALQPTQNATTIRVRQNKVSTTDGPFAETKEQLGGFYLINAKDLNEAMHDAITAALDSWPNDGVPENPRAWLISIGCFKAMDRLR